MPERARLPIISGSHSSHKLHILRLHGPLGATASLACDAGVRVPSGAAGFRRFGDVDTFLLERGDRRARLQLRDLRGREIGLQLRDLRGRELARHDFLRRELARHDFLRRSRVLAAR